MFENKTIKYILERINIDYFLPAIQRDYVWEEKQIINLFDSILKGYPIGTFLFWKVSKENILQYDYYRFITNYEKEKKYNDDKIDDLNNKDEIISILDGQQRLTSLNIGLKGSYKNKKLQFLYVNLTKMNDDSDIDDIQNKYLFKFMTEEDVTKQSNTNQWFKISKILDMSNGEVTMYAIKNGLSELGINIISDLHKFIHERTVINYYLVEENELDKVLSIFVRINKGGTHLSYSDLLLSIATSKWDNMSARDEINKLIEEVNLIDGEFNVTKDFILKTSLLLINENTKFTSKNLKPENMKKMENNWEKIRDSIIRAFSYLSENNYDNRSLPSMNIASFLSYFFFTNDIKNSNESEQLNTFIFKSLMKNVYSSSIDTVLMQGRKYLEQLNISEEFNCNDMLNAIKLKNTIFRDDDILEYSRIKRTQKSFMLLMTRLFNSRNLYGLSEIISRTRAKSYNGIYKDSLNTIVNYQFSNISDIYIESKNYENLNDEELDNVLKNREKNIHNKLLELLH